MSGPADRTRSKLNMGTLDSIAAIRNSMSQHAQRVIDNSAMTQKQKEDMKAPHIEIERETPKFVEENREGLIIGVMRQLNWDDMADKQREEIIDLWKKKNPGWDNRILVYAQLKANGWGTAAGYINNIIASISAISIAPKPGDGMGAEEDKFYNITYPTAAAILWWAQLYGVSATKAISWNAKIYLPSIKQEIVYDGKAIGDAVQEHSFGISTFFITAIAVVFAISRVL